MKLLVEKRVETREEASVTVDFSGGKLRLEGRELVVGEPEPFVAEWSFEFDPSLIEEWPDMLEIAVARDGSSARLWYSEGCNSREGQSAQRARNNVRLDSPSWAFFALLPDETYAVYVPRGVFVEAGAEAEFEVVEVEGGPPRKVFYEHCTAIVPFFERMNAKRQSLARLSTQDLLATLEMQVDLLTAALLALHPADAGEPQTLALLRAIPTGTYGYAVYPGGVEQAGALVAGSKASLRAIQASYFARLAEIDNAEV